MENEVTNINWGTVTSVVTMVITVGVVIFRAGAIKQIVKQLSEALDQARKDFSNLEERNNEKFNSMGNELTQLKMKVQDNFMGLANQKEKTNSLEGKFEEIRREQAVSNIKLAALESGMENIQKTLGTLANHILKNESG